MLRSFSQTMSELRKGKGLSQRAAASALEISQALLSHYENGTREPGLGFVCRACRFYGVSADYLLGLSDGGPSQERQTLHETLSELETLTARIREALEETDA